MVQPQQDDLVLKTIIPISHLRVGMQTEGYTTMQALPTWGIFFTARDFIFSENWVLSLFCIAQVFSFRSIINFKAANV